MIQILPTRGDLHARAGAAARLGRHDRQLPADRPGRAHPEVQGRARREEHVDARLHPAHEQQEAAVRQHQRPQVLRARLQLRRLHQGHPEGLRRAQSGAHAQQPLGLPQGRRGLRLRSEEGQGVLRQGQGRRRADRAGRSRSTRSRSSSRPSRPRSCFQSDLAQIGVNLKIISDTWANITTNTAKAESTPDLWIHWVSTYFVDPENWVGQMYDSQFHGTWKASAWYKNAKVDELLRKARVTVAAGRAPAALRGGDPPDRRRQPRHLGLQHGRAPRRHRPGQGLPLLARRLGRRDALGAARGVRFISPSVCTIEEGRSEGRRHQPEKPLPLALTLSSRKNGERERV